MTITDEALNILRSGKPVAAELTTDQKEFCAFVMIIPQVPSMHENPDAWINWKLKDTSFISGFEVRFLEHHIKYTDEDWGMDYDYVLDDMTTRIKRTFISYENEIESAVNVWLKDLSKLEDVDNFNSSLVNSPIESYLNRLEERPHLWQ